MSQHHPDRLETKNPFSHELTGSFRYDGFDEVQSKVFNLITNQKLWAKLPVSDRLIRIKAALQYFETHRESIALDICEQMGRPLHHARGELNGFFERAHYLCSIAQNTLEPDVFHDKPGFERSIEHVPLGVIFVISAWNYPLLITVNSVVSALIAGNTVLLKHSSLTPKIGKHFESAFGKWGDHEILSHVIVHHETTGRIIEELPIDHVVFTGSVSGGRNVLHHTRKSFMMPTLELGGKDAAYVHHDADLKHAVDSIVDGAMFNAGQSCCGIERAYVHRSIYDEFVSQAEKLVRAYKLGDPKNESTSMGPLARESSAKKMKTQVDEAINQGAKLMVGGDVARIGHGCFFQPTLIVDVTHSMDIMQEENFGPILPVMAVDDVEAAIRWVNDSRYGLTAAIFTQDSTLAKQFADCVHVGTVFMNRCDYLDPALPWSGVKDSGCGSTLSKYGFYHVTRRKGFHFKIS